MSWETGVATRIKGAKVTVKQSPWVCGRSQVENRVYQTVGLDASRGATARTSLGKHWSRNSIISGSEVPQFTRYHSWTGYSPSIKGICSLILVIHSSMYPTNIHSAPTIYTKHKNYITLYLPYKGQTSNQNNTSLQDGWVLQRDTPSKLWEHIRGLPNPDGREAGALQVSWQQRDPR